MMYGEPRFTNDVDVVADIREKDIPKLHQYFSDKEYYFDEDMVKDAIRHRYFKNLW